MSKYSCSKCGAVLPREDVQREKNVALCRACGKAGKPVASFVPGNVAEENPFVTVESSGMHGMRITYRKKDWKSIPILLFAAIWIPVTVYWLQDWGWLGIRSCHLLFQALSLAFFIPFVWVGLSMAVHGLLLLLGKTVVEVDRGQGRVFRGVGPVGWSWRFSMPAHGGVEVAVRNKPGYREADWRPIWLIMAPRVNGRPFWFGRGIGDADAMRTVCALLNRQS